MMIVKVTKTRGFTLSLEDTFFEKQQGGVKLTPPAVLGLKISQNSWKNICARVSFLIKLQASVYNFIKRPWHSALSCEHCEIFRITILTEHL